MKEKYHICIRKHCDMSNVNVVEDSYRCCTTYPKGTVTDRLSPRSASLAKKTRWFFNFAG